MKINTPLVDIYMYMKTMTYLLKVTYIYKENGVNMTNLFPVHLHQLKEWK